MKAPGKYDRSYTTSQLMALPPDELDDLEAHKTISASQRMAVKFHLASKLPSRQFNEYQKLKAKADAANAEQQKAQAEVETLRKTVEQREREL